MQLKIITNKNTWNKFITQNEFEFYSFLCSWEWTLLQEWAWKKVLKYGIYKPHPTSPEGQGELSWKDKRGCPGVEG